MSVSHSKSYLQAFGDRPLRVLLVDDDSAERDALLQALAKGGLKVDAVEAVDVASARAALESGPYDCVLVDAALPDDDGLRVVEHARARGDVASILLASGEGIDAAHEFATRVAADCLPRSKITPERLVHSIWHVLNAQALRRRELQARGEVLRQSRRLQALVEGSARIHAAVTFEDVALSVAAEALALFEAREARVEVVGQPGMPSVTRRASSDAARPSGSALTLELSSAKRGSFGSLTLLDAALDDGDRLLAEQFVRSAVSALENAALLRVATAATLARDEMLAVVSHDLRSPLSTVSLGARLLCDSLSARGPELASDVDVVRRVERACLRMGRLIDDLLDAAQIESGSFAMSPRRCAVTDIVSEAVDGAAQSAEAARVKLRVRVSPSIEVLADPGRVLQVLSNLIGNALRFTPRGGEVAVSVERDGGFARITVSDAGSGIPAAHLGQLFDRFWKGEGGGGRGLGLYISRGIVDAHGGRISARSVEGRGSDFTFTLPLVT